MKRNKLTVLSILAMIAVSAMGSAAVQADLVNVAATSTYQYPPDMGAAWPGVPNVWGDNARTILNDGNQNNLVIASNQPLQPMFDLGQDTEIKQIKVFALDTPWASYPNMLSTVSIFMSTEATGQFNTGTNANFDLNELQDQADYKVENLSIDKSSSLWLSETGLLTLPGEYRYVVIRTNSPGVGNNIALSEIEIYTVPEPATLSLLALGGFAFLRRRR